MSNRHKDKIKANSFNRDILEIQRKYASNRRDIRPKERETSTLSNLIVIDEESEELGRPRKLVKPNNDLW